MTGLFVSCGRHFEELETIMDREREALEYQRQQLIQVFHSSHSRNMKGRRENEYIMFRKNFLPHITKKEIKYLRLCIVIFARFLADHLQ
jgi:hypothetical protein